jgi:hypothetical protein
MWVRAAVAAGIAAYLALSVSPVMSAGSRSAPALPVNLESYLSDVVRLSRRDFAALETGLPVTRMMATESKTQVTTFGIIWIQAPVSRFVQAQRTIETLEQGDAFPVTRRLSSPPALDDFAELQLSPEDVEALRECRPGDCDVKLDAEALEAISRVDWRAVDRAEAANQAMQRMLLRFATAYQRGGNARLPVYQDKGTPVSVDEEFRALLLELPPLPTFLPPAGDYLLDYPKAWLPGSTSFLYWQETRFGLKPTIRLSHQTIIETGSDVLVLSKMLYASHYFRSALEVRIAVPDASRGGFWLATISSSRADGLTGMTGFFVRGRVRNGVANGIQSVLTTTKARLEAP